MDILIKLAVALAVVVGLVALVEDELLPTLRAAPTTSSAAAAAIATPTSIEGTLTYSVNNVGTEVPYIVYKTSSGATATKALTFSSGSTCVAESGSYPCSLIANALSSYYGASVVHARGVLMDENIEIATLAPA